MKVEYKQACVQNNLNKDQKIADSVGEKKYA